MTLRLPFILRQHGTYAGLFQLYLMVMPVPKVPNLLSKGVLDERIYPFARGEKANDGSLTVPWKRCPAQRKNGLRTQNVFL